jgi:hypothetical protein
LRGDPLIIALHYGKAFEDILKRWDMRYPSTVPKPQKAFKKLRKGYHGEEGTGVSHKEPKQTTPVHAIPNESSSLFTHQAPYP